MRVKVRESVDSGFSFAYYDLPRGIGQITS